MKHSPRGRSRMITVKVDEREYAAIRRGAALHGMGMSEYMRLMGTMAAWVAAKRETLQGWPEARPMVIDERTKQDIDQRARLLNDAMAAVGKMEETSWRLLQMFFPTVEEITNLLEYIDTIESAIKN